MLSTFVAWSGVKVKYTFDIVMCKDTCEPICFKLGMMVNTSKLYSDCILNDLDVHSRSQGYGKARTCAVIMSNVHDS